MSHESLKRLLENPSVMNLPDYATPIEKRGREVLQSGAIEHAFLKSRPHYRLNRVLGRTSALLESFNASRSQLDLTYTRTENANPFDSAVDEDSEILPRLKKIKKKKHSLQIHLGKEGMRIKMIQVDPMARKFGAEPEHTFLANFTKSDTYITDFNGIIEFDNRYILGEDGKVIPRPESIPSDFHTFRENFEREVELLEIDFNREFTLKPKKSPSTDTATPSTPES